MQIISDNSIQQLLIKQGVIEAYRQVSRGLNNELMSAEYIAELLQVPISTCFALRSILQENPACDDDSLDSIPLFSLFQGLFLPLSGLSSTKVGQLFGLKWQKPTMQNKDLVKLFCQKEIGLDLSEKVALLMGDPFSGGVARMGQDTLLQVLSSLQLRSAFKLREVLPRIGDIGALFIQDCPLIRSDPPITAKEALVIVRNLPKLRTNEKKRLLNDLFARCGRLERYFLVRLILRRLNFGYEYRTELISQAIAEQFKVPDKVISNGIALSNIFEVARILEKNGIEGLYKLVIKPLNPVSPALAGTLEDPKRMKFPVWVECKYDGIRLLCHKETNAWGRVKYAAFTRRKHDWLNLVIGLDQALIKIGAHSFILDGELHGTVLDWEVHGQREATVYEVYQHIQGSTQSTIRLKYVLFDILYLNGQDFTSLPFVQRRLFLERLVQPLSNFQMPLPIVLAEGFEVGNAQELEKWYRYFCQQGHEGAIAKLPQATYALGLRSNDWLKKKKDLLLDLLITGAFWATSTGGGPRVFSSYLLSCRDDKELREIGSAEGLSQENNFEIIQRIVNEYLLTGKTLEMRHSAGIRHGIEVLPSIVVTVKFEDVTKDSEGVYSLRDIKILCVRPKGDTSPNEIDTYSTIGELYMKKRLG